IEHAQKAGRTAAMLDIGLSFGIRGREENAGLRFNERFQVGRNETLPSATLLHARIRVARSLSDLDRLHGGSEGDIAGRGFERRHVTLPLQTLIDTIGRLRCSRGSLVRGSVERRDMGYLLTLGTAQGFMPSQNMD